MASARHCAGPACESQLVPGGSGRTVTAAKPLLPASHHSAASTAGRAADSHQYGTSPDVSTRHGSISRPVSTTHSSAARPEARSQSRYRSATQALSTSGPGYSTRCTGRPVILDSRRSSRSSSGSPAASA